MAPERIDDADADLDPLRLGRGGRRDGEDAAAMAAFGQPDFAQAQALGLAGERNGLGDWRLVGQGQAEAHGRG